MADETEYEYGIVDKDNEMHRVSMTKEQADAWVAEWKRHSVKDSDYFRVAKRVIGPWVDA